MSTTLGIVEIPRIDECSEGRSAQDTLPLVGRRLGGKSLLEWVVRRVTESLLIDQIVIVVDEDQGELVERLAPSDVGVYVGSQRDSLGRVAAAVRQWGGENTAATRLVRTTLRSPFIDPEAIDRLVTTAEANPGFDYIGYFSLDGRPAVLSKVGFFADWCTAKALFEADRRAAKEQERGNALHYIYSHPELFQLRFIPVPQRFDRSDLRLTIDSQEDWDNVHLIIEALGPDRLDGARIVSLLDQQPALRERMALLNSRGE